LQTILQQNSKKKVMVKVYGESRLSINPDEIKALDAYTGVVLQAEPAINADTEQDYGYFRNKSVVIDEILPTKITDKVVVHYGGDEDLTCSLPPESKVLVTNFKKLIIKEAKDLKIGDNLVDATYYDIYHKKDVDLQLYPIFVQQVEYIEGEFDGYDIYLDTLYEWRGIYVDNVFVSNE